MPRRDLDAVHVEMLRANQTQESPVRPKDTQEDPHVKASRAFYVALEQSGCTAEQAAFCLKVSDSLVRRMCSVDARETLSTTQLFVLCRDLGPRFTWEYNKAFYLEHKLATIALREAVQSLGILAIGIE